MPLTFKTTGSFSNTDKFLAWLKGFKIQDILSQYGELGVQALSAATPERTGLTAESWSYEIDKSGSDYKITWTNSNVHEGVPIAVLIQYGHGTGTGGYVMPHDFINPAMAPVFQKIADDVWKAVTSA